MTAVFSVPPHAPADNWDNDFDFHPNAITSSAANDLSKPIPSVSTRISTTSSYLSEDWDQEQAPVRDTRPPMTLTPLHDDGNVHEWTESGPSTPPRRHMPTSTENWDDDFEDKVDTPETNQASRKSVSTKSAGPSRTVEAENWDDDFVSDTPGPSKFHNPLMPFVNETKGYHSPDDDEDDMELGFADREEDRTVTARSRRAALSRLTNSATQPATPPPPVPPLPLSLLAPQSLSAEQPFPRSPTASVFSVPTVNSGKDSYYHNSSTTHLRPTMSRTSVGGFANLPPSPRVHKERERRRLRKKSRPPEAVYELTVRNSISPTMRSSSEKLEEVEDDDFRSMSPQTPPSSPHMNATSAPSSSNHRNSISSSIGPPSPPNKTPLLSRIGSVKRWGVRRKRASATPSEVMRQENESGSDSRIDPDLEGTSSSFQNRQSWFFRASSNGSPATSSSSRMGEHSERSSPDKRKKNTAGSAAPDTPSKLVKRKSFGFMQIRRNQGPYNGDGSSSDLPEDLRLELRNENLSSSPRKSQAGPTQARHVSYGGLGIGRAINGRRIASSTDDLSDSARSTGRQRSHSRSRDRPSEDKEGSRSFLGNVRKISLVGRHRRTKSGVSVASIGEGIRKEPAIPTDAERKFLDPRMDSPSNTPRPPLLQRSHSGVESSPRKDVSIAPLPIERLPPSSSLTASPKPPTTPHSASLGRSAVIQPVSPSFVPRRNSLGDLKIPARISQAQVGLRRDLGMVREFAANVEQLKDLQVTYHSVVTEVQNILDSYAHTAQQSLSRSTSPSLIRAATSKARSRSNTSSSGNGNIPPPPQAYKELASNFYTINSKYRIAWECAELLIELGGGPPSSVPTSAPSTSVSAPAMAQAIARRDRSSPNEEGPGIAEPLNSSNRVSSFPTPHSPPMASPPTSASSAWRASTGRHDLNQRQLQLLKEMLNNPDSSFVIEDGHVAIPEEAFQSSTSVNRQWRWGDAMSSTVTLPSEESSARAPSPSKKRRSSRLGMSGIRDMLRALKRGTTVPPVPVSSVSLSTQASADVAHQPAPGRRRAKTSSGPESMRSIHERPTSPYGNLNSTSNKASPRRPSLASIFRIGQKKPTPPSSAVGSSIQGSSVSVNNTLQLTSSHQSGQGSCSTGEDEDWDHLSAAGDVEHVLSPPPRDVPTIRGRSPYLHHTAPPPTSPNLPVTPRRIVSGSQTSLTGGLSPRPTRLSNVEENMDDHRTPQASKTRNSQSLAPGPSPQGGPVTKTGSVRSMPPQPRADPQLAMTPENIKPLLENAREVHARLMECIAAIRALLADQRR